MMLMKTSLRICDIKPYVKWDKNIQIVVFIHYKKTPTQSIKYVLHFLTSLILSRTCRQ